MCKRPDCKHSKPVATKGIGNLIPSIELALNALAMEEPRKPAATTAAVGRATREQTPRERYGAGLAGLDTSKYLPRSRRSERIHKHVTNSVNLSLPREAPPWEEMPPLEQTQSGPVGEQKISATDASCGTSTTRKRRCSSSSIGPGMTKKHHTRHFVKHDYHDHSHDPAPFVPRVERGTNRGGVTTPFPLVVHRMLEAVENDGMEKVVSWRPHGRAFGIHDSETFVKSIMPKYFRQTKLSSFQRQLNLYGFKRLTNNTPDKGAYYHELFLKGRPHLCARMHRCRVKGTGVRTASNPETEPEFYKMEPLGDVSVEQYSEVQRPAATASMEHEEGIPAAAATVSSWPDSMEEQEQKMAAGVSSWQPDDATEHSPFACGQRLYASKRHSESPLRKVASPTPLPPLFDNTAVQHTFTPFATSSGSSYYLPTLATPILPTTAAATTTSSMYVVDTSRNEVPNRILLPTVAVEPLQRPTVSFHSDTFKEAAAAPAKDSGDDDVSSIGSFLEEFEVEADTADDTDYYSEAGFGRLLENIVNHHQN